ncbi:uL15 family ribosomal protein [Candidatus Parcubacteria bacterium]|nr:uL15 family ribosomal protein [Candidatus Parcubacteria bacterium]
MQIHNLIRIHKNKKMAPVGRGGKRGKTSGKGTKGQNARSGRKKRPEMRDIIKRIPKLRGRGKNSFLSIVPKTVGVRMSMIEKVFEKGATVTPGLLVEKGLLSGSIVKKSSVKILSGGVSKPVSVSGFLVSKKAKELILKAGGTVA